MNPIMLINQGHTRNLGDVAIMQVLRRFLESRGMTVVFAPYEEETPAYRRAAVPDSAGEGLPDITPTFLDEENAARVARYLDRTPVCAAVIGGGELIGSHYGFNSAFHNWTRTLHERGIPILVAGVSGDARLPDRYKARLREGLKLCSYVSVRDGSTRRIASEQYGIQAHQAPDVVFAHRLLFGGERPGDEHRDVMVCMPVPYSANLSASLGVKDEHGYLDYLLRIIRARHSDQPERVVFTSTVDKDIPFAGHAAQYVGERIGSEVSVQPYGTVDDLVRLVSHATLVITARMHGAIFALDYGSRSVPIPFKEKLRVFGEEFGGSVTIESVERQAMAGLNHLGDAIERVI